MIALIEKLLANGGAYKVEENGGTNVYFDVSSFPAYGRLSGNTLEGLEPGARIEVRAAKKHPADFALWIHNPAHLMQWTAPWGTGYPGWHVECSAMAVKYLGETLDIHTGGEDNKFPHHECEIAQSEGSTGKPFARTWLHATHLLVDGKKMSKSLGNVYTLDDLTAKGADLRAVRYLLVGTHYRTALNFTLAGLDGAKSALGRIDALADAARLATPREKGRGSKPAKEALKAFDAAIDDDLNVSEALAALFGLVKWANEAMAAGTFTQADRAATLEFLEAAGQVLGFVFGRGADAEEVPASVLALVEKRDEARKEKRYAESDRLRDELKALGWAVEDTADGRRIKRV
jgi:cysteinyl-tRNA synthetase